MNAVNTIVFLIVLVILIFGGYIIGKEWNRRFGFGKSSSSADISSAIPDQLPPSSVDAVLPSSSLVSSSKPQTEFNSIKAKHMAFGDYVGKSTAQIDAFISDAVTQGYSAISVELKAEDGSIYYKSNSPMAQDFDAVARDAVDINTILAPIKNANLTAIARISALKDKTAPNISRKNGYAYGDQIEVNWWDNSAANGGKPWLNPYMENTRAYIAGLSLEVSSAGFDAVYLSNVIFPEKNTQMMNVINETMARDDILKKVVADAQALCDVPVVYEYALTDVEMALEQIIAAKKDFPLSAPIIKVDVAPSFDAIFTQQDISCYTLR